MTFALPRRRSKVTNPVFRCRSHPSPTSSIPSPAAVSLMDLHQFLDWEYGGDEALVALLDGGADLNARRKGETPLHVAARRRRCAAARTVLARGADADARDAGRKTAYVHALRRGFGDFVAALEGAAPSRSPTPIGSPSRSSQAVSTRRAQSSRSRRARRAPAIQRKIDCWRTWPDRPVSSASGSSSRRGPAFTPPAPTAAPRPARGPGSGHPGTPGRPLAAGERRAPSRA